VDSKTIKEIFGGDLLDDQDLLESFKQLNGNSVIKPFECVGTIDEVNEALQYLLKRTDPVEYPRLLKLYRKSFTKDDHPDFFNSFLKSFNTENNLRDQELKLLNVSKYG